jgi:hypothetical protein
MTDAQLESRLKELKLCSLVALAGSLLVIAVVVANSSIVDTKLVMTLPMLQLTLLLIGASAVVPAATYVLVLAFWHWWTRYRGKHSGLWGVLLVLEWSGLTKVLYLFRHVIADSKGSGLYAKS